MCHEEERMKENEGKREYKPLHNKTTQNLTNDIIQERIIERRRKNKTRDRIVIIVIILILAIQFGFYRWALYLNHQDGEVIADKYLHDHGESVIEDYEDDTYEELDAESLNYIALSYLDEERYDDAVKVLLEAEKIIDLDDIKIATAIYNNLCWGNNGLGNYEKALEYGKKGLELGDVSSYIYTNLGNSLYGLYEYDEAIAMYKKAIDAEEGADNFVLSNIGEAYYQLGNYKMASQWFDEYHKKVPEDPQGLYDLAWSVAMEYGDWERGYVYLKKMNGLGEKDVILGPQSDFLNYYQAYEENYKLLLNQERDFYVDFPEITANFLVAANYTGHFEEGILVAENAIDDGSLDLNIWYNLLDLYYLNTDHQKAYNLVSRYDLMTEDGFTDKLEVAYMYSYNFYYKEAAIILEDLVNNRSGDEAAFDQWEEALQEWINVLSAQENYDKLIHVIRRFETKTESINMNYELAYVYEQIGEFAQAKEHLKKSIEKYPDDQRAYRDLIDLYLYDGEADEAKRVIQEMETRDFSQEVINYQRSYYEEMVLKSPSDWLFDYIEAHYMYLDDPTILDELRESYKDYDSFSSHDLDAISEKVFTDDIFSYMVYPDEVKMMFDTESTQSVSGVWLNSSDYLLDVDFFSSLTDTETYRLLSRLKDTEDKNLIIDLRENYGGDADSAYHILDYLLPNLYLGDWDSPIEESFSYYSNGDYFDFNEIFILVNNHTASSAEMIALGLQQLTDNTLVVGQTTYGKGVGQVGNVNMNYGFGVFVVNAYWTIQGMNIHETGVIPDVKTEVTSLQDMLTEARSR